jgi:hypothetical protein
MICLSSLKEIERVAKKKYLVVESYRNEKEKMNLLYWQVTCEAFCTPKNGNGGLKRQIIKVIFHLYILNDKKN